MGGRDDRFPAMKIGRKGRQISGNEEWTERQTDFQQSKVNAWTGMGLCE